MAFKGTYLGNSLAKKFFHVSIWRLYMGSIDCENFTGKTVSLLINYTSIVWYYLAAFFLLLCFSKQNFLMVMHTLNVFLRISNYRKELLGAAKYYGLNSWFQNIFWCKFLDVYSQLFSPRVKNSFLLSLKNIFCFLLSHFSSIIPFCTTLWYH